MPPVAAGLTHAPCQQVFHCFWGTAMVYVFAQLLGSVASAALILPLYGFGQFGSLFDTRILSFLGLSVPPHLRAQARRPQIVPVSDIRSASHTDMLMHTAEWACAGSLSVLTCKISGADGQTRVCTYHTAPTSWGME